MCENQVHHRTATQNARHEASTEIQHLQGSEYELRGALGVSKIHIQVQRPGMDKKNAQHHLNTLLYWFHVEMIRFWVDWVKQNTLSS